MKKCENCFVVMIKPKKYSYKQWEDTNNCSSKCSTASTIKKGKRFLFTKGHKHSQIVKNKISEKLKGNENSGLAETHHRWRGGRFKSHGYIYVHSPEHPNKTGDGYVLEHRLIMEKRISRLLNKEEVVHHINEKRDDNRIKNLMLFNNNGEHKRWHLQLASN